MRNIVHHSSLLLLCVALIAAAAPIAARNYPTKPVIARLHDDIVKALQQPDVKQRLTGIGFEIAGSTPEQFAAYIKSEIKKWEKVVKASGAKPE